MLTADTIAEVVSKDRPQPTQLVGALGGGLVHGWNHALESQSRRTLEAHVHRINLLHVPVEFLVRHDAKQSASVAGVMLLVLLDRAARLGTVHGEAHIFRETRCVVVCLVAFIGWVFRPSI